VFHFAQPLQGIGIYTSKIVASTGVATVDEGGKHVDRRRPISFANNGTQDIAIADLQQNQVVIKQGNTAGTAFTDYNILASLDSLSDMVVGDVNADGLPDLVVIAGGYVQVLINTSNLTTHAVSFAMPVLYEAKDQADVHVADLLSVALVSVDTAEGTGGKMDIVAGAKVDHAGDPTHPTGYLFRFTNLGNAAGGFTPHPAIYPTPHAVTKIAVGDLNNDGFTDIVVAAAGDHDTVGQAQRFDVIKNVASGGLRSIDPALSTPEGYIQFDMLNLAVGDIDADGGRDVVVLNGTLTQDPNTGNTASSSVALWHNKNDGTGALENYSSLALKTNLPTGSGVTGNLAIGDLNADGTVSEVAVADGLDEKVSILTFDPFLQGLNHSISSTTCKVTTVTAGVLAQAVDIGDLNHDFGMDLVVANSETTTPGNYFLNTKAGVDDGGGAVSDPIPDGNVVTFGSIVGTGLEGTDFTVNLLRGKDSTGQVLVYINFGGDAVQLVTGVKNADYSLTYPTAGAPVVFPDTAGPEAHLQQIKIHTIKNTVAEASKTLFLSFGSPLGDAITGPSNSASVELIDGKPLVLAAPGVLTITPTSIVKLPAVQLAALKLKQVARTNSNWTFSVTEAFPKAVLHAAVKLQYTTHDNPVEADWQDLANLTAKGNVWSTIIQQMPLATKITFRTVGSADGYKPVVGKTSAAYAIQNGPLLQMSAGINTAYTPGFYNKSTNIVATAAEDTIKYRFEIKNAQVATGATANHVLLTAKIPTHTTYFNGVVSNQSITAKMTTVKGAKAIQWDLGSLPQTTDPLGTTYVELQVKVDKAATINKANPLKALGVQIAEDLFTLTSDEAAPVSGPPAALYAVIHGPIELAVSRPGTQSAVQGGDVIDYELVASNTSGAAVTNGKVRSRIPAGTVLSQVYFPDADGNSSVNVLPNPGALTNPAVVYVVLKNASFLNFKFTKGMKFDPALLGDTLLKSLLDRGYIAQEIEWFIPTIAANSHVTLKYQVRVIYDLGKDSAGQQTIVNDDFDFTIGSGTSLISALYGKDPDPGPLTSTFDPSEPDNLPELRLKKSADGGLALSNPDFHGNGMQYIAGIGDVVTCLPANGVDYLLTYRNKGLAAAHNVTIHDVIPVGLELRGFFEMTADGKKLPANSPPTMYAEQFTFYDLNGLPIPAVDPLSNASNMKKVRSMDIRLGALQNYATLPANTTGVIRYTCQPIITPATVTTYSDGSKTGPGEIHSFGGYLASEGVNGKLQGFFITSSDLNTPADGAPEDLVVRVLGDISWGLPQYARHFINAIPGSIFHFDIPFAQNGDVTAPAAHVDFTVPQGATFLDNQTFNNQTYYPGIFFAQPTDANDKGIQLLHSTQSAVTGGTRVSVPIGDMLGHVTGVVRVWFQVNSVQVNGTATLDPVLKANGGAVYPKDIAFGPVSIVRTPGIHTVAAAVKPTQSSTAGNPTIAKDASAPHLTLQRTAPYTVPRNGSFTYVINFANTGQTAATNVTIGMQIPFFTHSKSVDTADNGYLALPGLPDSNGNPRTIITPNAEHYKHTDRTDANIIKQSGAGYDKVFWHFASVPPNTTGRVTLTVVVAPGFGDKAVSDHSLYISADNAPSVVISPNPLSTWVLGDKKFQDVKALILARFCSELGMTMNAKLESALSAYEDKLGPDSRVAASSALDQLKIGSISIAPIGNDRFIVTAPADVVSNDGHSLIEVTGGAVVSNDGHSLIAQGAGSAITLHANGLAVMNASAVLDGAADLLANKQASLIAAGGGNLISQDGGGKCGLVSNHPGGGLTLIGSDLTGLIAAGAGNIISDNSAGIIAGVGALISNDGAGLISNDGAGLISNDGAGLVGNAGGTLTVDSIGNNFSNNGVGFVGQEAVKTLGPNGAALKQ
jgi:uncharacterized repeat protein (TIGR01451 family)